MCGLEPEFRDEAQRRPLYRRRGGDGVTSSAMARDSELGIFLEVDGTFALLASMQQLKPRDT
jgi:hypothetical protein